MILHKRYIALRRNNGFMRKKNFARKVWYVDYFMEMSGVWLCFYAFHGKVSAKPVILDTVLGMCLGNAY